MATREGVATGSFAGRVTISPARRNGGGGGSGGGGGGGSITGTNVQGTGTLSDVTVTKVTPPAATSTAVQGGYDQRSYEALTPAERSQVDEFYSKNPPLGAVVAGEPGSMLVSYRGGAAQTAGELTRRLREQNVQNTYRATSYAGRSVPTTPEYRAQLAARQAQATQAPTTVTEVRDTTPQRGLTPGDLVKRWVTPRNVVNIANPLYALTKSAPARDFYTGAVDFPASAARGTYKLLFSETERVPLLKVPGTSLPIATVRIPRGSTPQERVTKAGELLKDPDVQTASIVAVTPAVIFTPVLGTALRYSVPVVTAYDAAQTIKEPSLFNIGRTTTNVALSAVALRPQPAVTIPQPKGAVSIFGPYGLQVYEVYGKTVRPARATRTFTITEYTGEQGSRVRTLETERGVYTRFAEGDKNILVAQTPTGATPRVIIDTPALTVKVQPPTASTRVTTTTPGRFFTTTVSRPVPGGDIRPVVIEPGRVTTSKPTYTATQPGESIVTQRAGVETTTQYSGTIDGKPLRGGIITAGETKAVSYSERAPFSATDTPLDITPQVNLNTGNLNLKVTPYAPETVYKGKTPVPLRVAQGERLANEFSITRNVMVPAGEPTIYLTELGNRPLGAPVPTGEVNLFSGVVDRPPIASMVKQRIVSAGYLELNPPGEARASIDYGTLRKGLDPTVRLSTKKVTGKVDTADTTTIKNVKTGRVIVGTTTVVETAPLTVEQLPATSLTPSRVTIGLQGGRTQTPATGVTPGARVTPPLPRLSQPVKTEPTTRFNYDYDTDTKVATLPSLQFERDTRITPREDFTTRSRSSTTPAYKVERVQEVDQVPEQELKTDTVTLPLLETGFNVPLRLRLPREPLVPIIPAFPFRGGFQQPERYNLFIRQQGRFKPLGSYGLREAFEKGVTVTRATSAASFKITGTERLSSAKGYLPTSFYKSQREPGVYIQRRGTRITTAGEKAEITLKGIRTARYKRRR